MATIILHESVVEGYQSKVKELERIQSDLRTLVERIGLLVDRLEECRCSSYVTCLKCELSILKKDFETLLEG